MSVLAAERIKLTTTKSPWWCTAIIVVLSLGFAALIGWTSSVTADGDFGPPGQPGFEAPQLMVGDVLTGVSGFGVLVLMILAALAVTSEYRFGIIRTTFQAVTSRASVLFTKAALIGVFGVVLTLALSFGAFFIARAFAGEEAGAALTLDNADSWRAVFGVAIYAFLCVFLAVGVGALLRQSAAAIALLLLWPLLLESLFNLFGSVGRDILPFLPFQNANNFLGTPGGVEFHWGPWGSLAYFAAFVAIVFAAAVVVVNKRDA